MLRGVYIPNRKIDPVEAQQYVYEYVLRKKLKALKEGVHPTEYRDPAEERRLRPKSSRTNKKQAVKKDPELEEMREYPQKLLKTIMALQIYNNQLHNPKERTDDED